MTVLGRFRSFCTSILAPHGSAGCTSRCPPLTHSAKRGIMCEPGVRSDALSVLAFTHLKVRHERLQPQGRGDFRTREQVRRGCSGAHREGNGGFCRLPQQRGCACGAPTLHQGAACGGRKDETISRLSGPGSSSAQVSALSDFRVLSVVFLLVLLTACAEKKHARVVPVPPPPISDSRTQAQTQPAPQVRAPATNSKTQQQSAAESQEAPASVSVPPDAKPISVETGLASWYGAPYHNRRGSNGEVYDMSAMTAAQRTLPLGSIARVTNLKTGHSAVVRITDRGPFINGRIVDLSLAAAKKTDVWQPGIARVRVEVLQTPTLLETSGRWAVQIGAFDQENAARTLAGRLSQRYRTAKVLCFNSPVGDWWVRVRVRGDDKKRAEELAHETQTPQGSIFLVRLD